MVIAPLGMARQHRKQRHRPGSADEQPWPEQETGTMSRAALLWPLCIALIDQVSCHKSHGAPLPVHERTAPDTLKNGATRFPDATTAVVSAWSLGVLWMRENGHALSPFRLALER